MSKAHYITRDEALEMLRSALSSGADVGERINKAITDSGGVGVCANCGGIVKLRTELSWFVILGRYRAAAPKCSSCGAEPKPLAMVERRKEGR